MKDVEVEGWDGDKVQQVCEELLGYKETLYLGARTARKVAGLVDNAWGKRSAKHEVVDLVHGLGDVLDEIADSINVRQEVVEE